MRLRPNPHGGLTRRAGCIFPGLTPNRSVSAGTCFSMATISLGCCSPCCCCRSRRATGFKLGNFTTNEALYRRRRARVSSAEVGQRDHGVREADLDLPARDTLLPRSLLVPRARPPAERANTCSRRRASRASSRAFPDDTLADDARSRRPGRITKLWRRSRSSIRSTARGGRDVQDVARRCIPTSPLIPQARSEIGELERWFATKDYVTGMYYFRRKAYDSAIIYFKDVVTKYPERADGARRASAAGRGVPGRSAIATTPPNRARSFDAAISRRSEVSRRASTSVPPARRQPTRVRDAGDRPRRAEPCGSASSAGVRSSAHRAPACRLDAVEQLGARPLVFVPAARPAAQGGRGTAQRRRTGSRWCDARARDDPASSVDAIEIDRGGLSYTVDTLARRRAAVPVGRAVLARWRRRARVVRPVAGARSGSSSWRRSSCCTRAATTEAAGRGSRRRRNALRRRSALAADAAHRHVVDRDPRAACGTGQSIRGFVPDAVAGVHRRARGCTGRGTHVQDASSARSSARATSASGRRIQPIVDEINEHDERLQAVSEEELRGPDGEVPRDPPRAHRRARAARRAS